MKSSKKDLNISIVNYNAGEYLLNCLESIEQVNNEANIQVFVIDNASTDGSFEKAKEEFSQFKYIKNTDNLGFGKAHNIILKRLDSGYILILNPDTKLQKGVISKILDFMDKNAGVGAATCEILLPDGRVDLTAHRRFPTPLTSLLYFLGDESLYHLTNRNLNQPHEVDAISGSFFLTRKSVLDKVGLFDEDYFMYAEDIDLCYRIKQWGYKIMYVPEVSIIHYKGVSSGLKKNSQTITTATEETRKKSLDAFYQTMKIFYRKHYEKQYPTIIKWLVYLGIDLRWWLAKRKLTV